MVACARSSPCLAPAVEHEFYRISAAVVVAVDDVAADAGSRKFGQLADDWIIVAAHRAMAALCSADVRPAAINTEHFAASPSTDF